MSVFRGIKKKRTPEIDPLEQRLDAISDLTRGLGKPEFNNLMDAVKAVFEARQKLLRVKTDDEKEMTDIAASEKQLNLMEEK